MYGHFYAHAHVSGCVSYGCVSDAQVHDLNDCGDYGYKFTFCVNANILNEAFKFRLKTIDDLCMACHYENANVPDVIHVNEIRDDENSHDDHHWGRYAK